LQLTNGVLFVQRILQLVRVIMRIVRNINGKLTHVHNVFVDIPRDESEAAIEILFKLFFQLLDGHRKREQSQDDKGN